MATIVHFDINADNTERAEKFYEGLFNWKFTKMPSGMNYSLIETRDLKGEIGIGGGLSKREIPHQSGVTNFMGIVSIDESAIKVIELGGKIIQQKQAIPGWGYLCVCMDTENNLFGLFQEGQDAK